MAAFAHTQNETATAADTPALAATYGRLEAETATAEDAAAAQLGYLRGIGETATAVDTGTLSTEAPRREDETVVATDSMLLEADYHRDSDEVVTAVDDLVEEDNYRKRRSEFVIALDSLSAVISKEFERSETEILYVSDFLVPVPDTSWLPRKVYVRHMNKIVYRQGVPPFSPAIGVQYRDWSNNLTSGLFAPTGPTGPTDGNTPIFRQGKTTEILAEAFAEWTSPPKTMIAHHMNRGELKVFEDYLGTQRELSSSQVMQYNFLMDQPWVTFVDHRSGLLAADAGAPTSNDGGTLAVDFGKVLLKPVFTGGTAPTVDLAVYARTATQPRGTWTLVSTNSSVSGQVEITTGYQEVLAWVTAVSGSPTSFDIQISGTA